MQTYYLNLRHSVPPYPINLTYVVKLTLEDRLDLERELQIYNDYARTVLMGTAAADSYENLADADILYNNPQIVDYDFLTILGHQPKDSELVSYLDDFTQFIIDKYPSSAHPLDLSIGYGRLLLSFKKIWDEFEAGLLAKNNL